MGQRPLAGFQEVKSLAVSDGTITLEEGMAIYSYLGESGPDKFNAAPVAVKVALTNAFAELLAMQMGA